MNMSIDHEINQLIVLRETVNDWRQRQALDDAITMMRSVSELYILAYMRGFHEGRKKERMS